MRARKEMARAFSEMNLMMVNIILTTTAFFSFRAKRRGSSIFFMRLLRDSAYFIWGESKKKVGNIEMLLKVFNAWQSSESFPFTFRQSN